MGTSHKSRSGSSSIRGRQGHKKHTGKTCYQRLRFEQLESRQLLSVAPISSAGQSSGVLDPNFGDGGKAIFSTQTQPISLTVACPGDSKPITLNEILMSPEFQNIFFTPPIEILNPINAVKNEAAPPVSSKNETIHSVPPLASEHIYTDYFSEFLDPKFGNGGIAIGHSLIGPTAFAVATQADGKTITFSGGAMDPGLSSFLTRFNTDGTLDKTFGNGGTIIITSLRHDDTLWESSLVIQADGKIVVVGEKHSSTGQGPNSGVLLRFNADGSPDTSFGAGGTVITNFGDTSGSGTAVILAPDGKLFHVSAGNESITMARYNSDGKLDPTFGIGGMVVTSDPFVRIEAVQMQSDGKMLIGGAWNLKAAIIRLNADGTLDSTFGINGEVLNNPWSYDPNSASQSDGKAHYAFAGSLSDIAIQADGKILAIVYAYLSDLAPGGCTPVLVRLNSDGSFDSGFGQNGNIIRSFYDSNQSLLVQLDGKIVVESCRGLTCYNADGTIDATFGDRGTVSFQTPGTSVDLSGGAITGGPDGSVVVAGMSRLNTVVMRFLSPSVSTSGDTNAAALRYAPAAQSSPQQIKFLSTNLQPGMSLFTPFNAANYMDSFSQWQPVGLTPDLSSGVISGNTVGFDKQPLWTINSQKTSRLNSDSVDTIFSDTFGVVGNSLETDSLLSLVELQTLQFSQASP